jgi:hypothetical protein
MQLTQLVTLAATVIASGWVAAFLVQLLKREAWPSWVKLVLALVVSALVGLGAAWLSGDVTRFVTLWKSGAVTSDQVIAFAVLVFTSAQVWFHKFFSDQTWAQTLAKWPKG